MDWFPFPCLMRVGLPACGFDCRLRVGCGRDLDCVGGCAWQFRDDPLSSLWGALRTEWPFLKPERNETDGEVARGFGNGY